MVKKTTTKVSRTSLEPSEIFCAVGLIMPSATMRELCKDQTGSTLLLWATGPGLALCKSGKIDMTGNQSKFYAMFTLPRNATDKKRTALVANIVAGFSAALAIKEFMASMGDHIDVVPNVYLTGSRWGLAVRHFRLMNENDGFDYNSSDLVVEADKQTYYGISLKKKKNVKGADPTLINKAFDTFLQGKTFDTARKELLEARQEYFPMLIRKALAENFIKFPGLENKSNEYIWNYQVPKPGGGKVALINLKGKNKKDDDTTVDISDLPDEYFDAPGSGQQGLRDYINNDLSHDDNELYQEFNKVIEENVEVFAEGLIDIVLKTQMQAKLSAKDIGDYFFEFALVTGYADFTAGKNPRLHLNAGNYKAQHSILCGLANLAGHNEPYIIEYDHQKKIKSGAAKLFYKLSRAGVPILDLQLRYKGDFKQQPQFFANLAPEFVTQLHEKCLIRKKH
jgi:hypothetical protein